MTLLEALLIFFSTPIARQRTPEARQAARIIHDTLRSLSQYELASYDETVREDVLSDVLLQLTRMKANCGRLPESENGTRSYLRRMLRNRAIDLYRASTREPTYIPLSHTDTQTDEESTITIPDTVQNIEEQTVIQETLQETRQRFEQFVEEVAQQRRRDARESFRESVEELLELAIEETDMTELCQRHDVQRNTLDSRYSRTRQRLEEGRQQQLEDGTLSHDDAIMIEHWILFLRRYDTGNSS